MVSVSAVTGVHFITPSRGRLPDRVGVVGQ